MKMCPTHKSQKCGCREEETTEEEVNPNFDISTKHQKNSMLMMDRLVRRHWINWLN